MIQYEVALEQLEIFVLILMRIASFIYVAPFFNTANVPRRTKIGLAFFVTVLVYSVKPDMTVEYSGIIGYAVVVLQEVASWSYSWCNGIVLRPDYYVCRKNDRYGYRSCNGSDYGSDN